MVDPLHIDHELSRTKYSSAGWMQFKSARDYAAARCLLLNGLFDGLSLGGFAIEKMLKTVIMYGDPECNVKETYGHNIKKLASDCTNLGYIDLSDRHDVIKRFSSHMLDRYPREFIKEITSSTSEVDDLDALILDVNDCLLLPPEFKLRSGICANVVPVRKVSHPYLSPLYWWTLQENHAILARQIKWHLEFCKLFPDQCI